MTGYSVYDLALLEDYDNPERADLIPHVWGLPFDDDKKAIVTNPVELNIAADGQTQRYQEHSFPDQFQPLGSPEWTCELARFVVPKKSIGFVRGLDQVLYDGAVAIEDVIPPINGLLWLLTVSPYYGQWPARYQVVGASPQVVPGRLYQMPALEHLWYSPRCGYSPLNMVFGGGTLVRFFFYSPAVPNDEYRWRVVGRLRGFTQIDNNNLSAVANARGQW